MRERKLFVGQKKKCKGDVVFKCSKIINTNSEMNQSKKRRILIYFGTLRLLKRLTAKLHQLRQKLIWMMKLLQV